MTGRVRAFAIAAILVGCGGGTPAPAAGGASPPSTPEAPKRTVITEETVQILDPIQFVDGAAAVTPGSTPILDALAATLAGNPTLRLVEVQVSAADEALAQARAESILEELVGRGIAPERLRANAIAADSEAGKDVAFAIIARTP